MVKVCSTDSYLKRAVGNAIIVNMICDVRTAGGDQ
jgi:hypothetical protein